MRIKNLLDEDFVNYKKPAMFIGTGICDFKCFKELNLNPNQCINFSLGTEDFICIANSRLVKRYLKNQYTEAVVIGGMEPFLQFNELLELIEEFRRYTDDPIIIYTGYYKDELKRQIKELKKFKNIIIKFGRYIPNDDEHYDDVLGIYLASSNQYAEQIS